MLRPAEIWMLSSLSVDSQKCRSLPEGYSKDMLDHLADRVGGGGRFTIVIGSMFS